MRARRHSWLQERTSRDFWSADSFSPIQGRDTSRKSSPVVSSVSLSLFFMKLTYFGGCFGTRIWVCSILQSIYRIHASASEVRVKWSALNKYQISKKVWYCKIFANSIWLHAAIDHHISVKMLDIKLNLRPIYGNSLRTYIIKSKSET